MNFAKRIIGWIGISMMALGLSSCLGDSNQSMYYQITMPDDTVAYSVNALSNLEVKKGDDFRFQVLRKHHVQYDYENIKVYANQTIIQEDAAESSVYYVKNVVMDTTITIQLDKYSFNVSFEHDEAYEIDILSDITDKIDYGEDLNFKINYDEKYKDPNVYNGDVKINPNSEKVYSIANVKADVTIKIDESTVKTFFISSYLEPLKYEIIAPTERRVEYGSDFKFQVVPQTAYYYAEDMCVLINGIELEKSIDGYYYIRDIKENKMITISGLVRIPSYSVSFGRGINGLANYLLERLNFGTSTINENTVIEFRLDLKEGYEAVNGSVWVENWNSSSSQYEKIKEITPDENGVYSLEITENVVINATPATIKKYNATYVVNKNPRFEVEYGLKVNHGSSNFTIVTNEFDVIIEEEISLTIIGNAKYSHYTKGTGLYENRYTFYLTDIEGEFTYQINGIYNTNSMGAGHSNFYALFEINGEIYDIGSSEGKDYRNIYSEDLVFRIIPEDGKQVGPTGLVVDCWSTEIGTQTLTPDEDGFYRIENVTSFLRFYIYGFIDA